MRIAITGHTKGIGKAIYDLFQDHNITGFSRSNGFDIRSQDVRKSLIKSITDYDVFINNAFDKTGQTALLTEIIDLWQSTDKLIVHLNSKAIFAEPFCFQIESDLDFKDYVKEKRKQQTIIESRIRKTSPNILNVLLGPVDCGFGSLWDCKKLNPNLVAEYIFFCIESKGLIQTQQLILDVPNQSWDEISIKSFSESTLDNYL